jgi:hypothetical protein
MWCYRQSGTEPTLDEVIHEPVIRLIMERDHVTEEALVRLLASPANISAGLTSSSARESGSCCPILSPISSVPIKRKPVARRSAPDGSATHWDADHRSFNRSGNQRRMSN